MGLFNIFKKKKKDLPIKVKKPVIQKMVEKPILNEDVEVVEELDQIMEMQQKMYQDVVDLLLPHLPNGWKRIALINGEFDNWYSVKFYIDKGRGYKECFDFYDEFFLSHNLFIKIHNTTRRVRNRLSEKNKWKYFKMFIFNTGKFESDYEYDVDENDSVLYELHFAKKLESK